jgi:hypothetical protein
MSSRQQYGCLAALSTGLAVVFGWLWAALDWLWSETRDMVHYEAELWRKRRGGK